MWLRSKKRDLVEQSHLFHDLQRMIKESTPGRFGTNASSYSTSGTKEVEQLHSLTTNEQVELLQHVHKRLYCRQATKLGRRINNR